MDEEDVLLHNKVLLKVQEGDEESSFVNGQLLVYEPPNLPDNSALKDREDMVWWTSDVDFNNNNNIKMSHPSTYITRYEAKDGASDYGVERSWDMIKKDVDSFGYHMLVNYPTREERAKIEANNSLPYWVSEHEASISAVCTHNFIRSPRAVAYIENNRIINDCPSGNIELAQVWWYHKEDVSGISGSGRRCIDMHYVWLGGGETEAEVLEKAEKFTELTFDEQVELLRVLQVEGIADQPVATVLSTIAIKVVDVIVYMTDFYNMRFLQNGQDKPYHREKGYDLGIGDTSDKIKQKWIDYWCN